MFCTTPENDTDEAQTISQQAGGVNKDFKMSQVKLDLQKRKGNLDNFIVAFMN